MAPYGGTARRSQSRAGGLGTARKVPCQARAVAAAAARLTQPHCHGHGHAGETEPRSESLGTIRLAAWR
jgi:hypothetical protein